MSVVRTMYIRPRVAAISSVGVKDNETTLESDSHANTFVLGGGPDQSAALSSALLNRAAREGSISTIGLDIVIVIGTEQGFIVRVVICGLLHALDFTRSLLCGFGNAEFFI